VARFRAENRDRLERNQRAQFAGAAASQWLGLRLQLIGVVMVTGVAAVAVIEHTYSTVDAGTQVYYWGCKFFAAKNRKFAAQSWRVCGEFTVVIISVTFQSVFKSKSRPTVSAMSTTVIHELTS